MDDLVLRAMAKWPNVPSLFGWLGLDRRGYWLLQGERIEHAALVEFIGRNYARDERGYWYFQNGPQRGYVTLEYTPWVLRLQASGRLHTQTGLPVDDIPAAFIDESGSLLLAFESSVGLLLDTDLDWAVTQLRRCDAGSVNDADIGMTLITISALHSENVPQRFGFVREPAV